MKSKLPGLGTSIFSVMSQLASETRAINLSQGFHGGRHHSLLEHDDLWPRTLLIPSFGKTFHVTGWKLGYCIAPVDLSATSWMPISLFAGHAMQALRQFR